MTALVVIIAASAAFYAGFVLGVVRGNLDGVRREMDELHMAMEAMRAVTDAIKRSRHQADGVAGEGSHGDQEAGEEDDAPEFG